MRSTRYSTENSEEPYSGKLIADSHRLCQTLAMGVTPQQFEQMKTRVRSGNAATRRAADPVMDPGFRPVTTHQIILGVDPSLRGTGFGVIRLGKPFPQTL